VVSPHEVTSSSWAYTVSAFMHANHVENEAYAPVTANSETTAVEGVLSKPLPLLHQTNGHPQKRV